jgi:hypothetical protein
MALEFMVRRLRELEHLGQAYAQQCEAMAENARRWREANPNRETVVQFNRPPKVLIIGTISDAVKHHFVTANEAGLELIKALWPWGGRDEPTVLMVRVVLEHETTHKRI